MRLEPFVAGTLWCCAKSKPAAIPFRQYTIAGYDFWSPVAPSRYYPVNNDKLRNSYPVNNYHLEQLRQRAHLRCYIISYGIMQLLFVHL